MTQPTDIVIAGVGGQGTVLASKLLAQAALLEGYGVRTAETIGMAQRGGSVLGHVRLGVAAPAPLSPLVPPGCADLLIGFEPGETVRSLDYLRPRGVVVTAQQALEPVTATLAATPYDGTSEIAYLRACESGGRIGSLVIIDGAPLCAQLRSTRILNVILLGAALATGALTVSEATLVRAIEMLVKPQYVDLNKTALTKGMERVG